MNESDCSLMLSIIGIAVSFASFIYAILIYSEQKKTQEDTDRFNRILLSQISNYSINNFNYSKIAYFYNLRSLALSNKGKDEANFWEFYWRFEMFDNLSLKISLEDESIRYFDV